MLHSLHTGLFVDEHSSIANSLRNRSRLFSNSKCPCVICTVCVVAYEGENGE